MVVCVLALAGAACTTQRQTVGTATGAAAGAVIGGPVGAVVGGAVGYVATAPGLRPGYCYVTNRRGYIRHNRYGAPLIRRC